MPSPYYRFGFQHPRYAYSWGGGAAGIPPGSRSAVRKGLGILQLDESEAPVGHRFPALADWPALRPAGPEPLDPGELGFWDGLSDNEKKLAVLGGAAAVWYFFLRKKRR
jgi:hypothetical protein